MIDIIVIRDAGDRPGDDAARARSVPESMIHAAVEAYLGAGEREPDLVGT